MNDTAVFEISLLPDPLRATIARGYREIADANRLLFAETGTALLLDLAAYADGRADVMEAGVSLLFDAREGTCAS